jgi:GDP-L-fucose synthase
MTTLITGGTGFVGSNLEGQYKVSSRDANLMDFEQTKVLLAKYMPKIIVHAAGRHGNYVQINEDKVSYYRDNALISINIFEAARLCGVKNMLAFSSVTAFPDRINHFSEEDLYQGEPHPSCYPYAYAKRIVDVLCRAYSEQYGLNYNCILLANAYGPGGKDNVIPTLIDKCLDAQENGREFHVLGDGTPRRDFIYIADVRRIISRLSRVENFGSVIVSSGTSVTIRDVVEEIVKAVGFEGEVIWRVDENVGQREKIPSNTKLQGLLPDFVYSHLSEGIRETVTWCRSQRNSRVS